QFHARIAGRRGLRQLNEAALVFEGADLHGVDELEAVLVAGVEALAQDAPARQGVRGEAQDPRHAPGEGGFGVVQAHADVADTDRHATAPAGWPGEGATAPR